MKYYKEELDKLKNLFISGAYVPSFYNRKLHDIDQLLDYESFQKIPCSYKWEVRSSSVLERTTTPIEDVYGIFSSSGTTGEKTFYICNTRDKAVHEKFVRTFFTELGINKSDIGCVMAPVDTGVMAHNMMWQFTTMGAGYVNCPVPTPENIIDTITKVPVTVIATRPSIASCVAYNPEHMDMACSSMVKKLLMGGGFLSTERRKLLEFAWGAECYNVFGMSEMFGPMASECRQKDGLHYLDDYLMIEILDPKTHKPVEDGTPGVAVYTTLWDKGFSLLRYWTDDLMVITHEPCKCGSRYPRLYFLGRLGDTIMVEGDYVFPENVENILLKYGNAGEYSIEKYDSEYLIKTEGSTAVIDNNVITEMKDLLKGKIKIETVPLGSLNSGGHAKRFIIK